MAILNNTVVEGNARVNGLLSTSAFNLNGTAVSLASNVADGGSGLVTAAMVKSYIQGNSVTPSRSGNTVSWGTGWVAAGSSTGTVGSATTPTASAAATSTSLSGTTLTVSRSVTPTVSAGWVTSGTAGTVTITATVPTETKSASGSGDITPTSGKLLSKVTVGAGARTTQSVNGTDAIQTANLTKSTTDNSGIKIQSKFTGVSRRGKITTAGWMAANTICGDTSGTLEGTAYYISDITIPKNKALNSVTLSAGEFTNNTYVRGYLTTLTVNRYSEITNLSLTGRILNLTHVYDSSYGDKRGYIDTQTLAPNSGSSSINLLNLNGGAIGSVEGTGSIQFFGTPNASATLNIQLNGFPASSSYKGTINIADNSNGTVNIHGGKTANGGVSIENRKVTVDGNGTNAGTTVTNSSGDLITTSLTGAGGAVTSNAALADTQTNATLSSTNNSGIAITATSSGSSAAVTYTNSTAGWLAAHTSATQILAGKTSAATANSVTKYLSAVSVQSGKSLTISNAGTVTVSSNSGTVTVESWNITKSGNDIIITV